MNHKDPQSMKAQCGAVALLSVCAISEAWSPRQGSVNPKDDHVANLGENLKRGIKDNTYEVRHQAKRAGNSIKVNAKDLKNTLSRKADNFEPEDLRDNIKEGANWVQDRLDRGLSPPPGAQWRYNLKIGSYFTLWYILSLAYNVLNKKVLKRVNLPVTLSAVQMLTGLVYLAPQYLFNLRAQPNVSGEEFRGLFPIGIAHAITHLAAVIALASGTVHFSHIIKSAEPVFTSLFSAVFLGEFFPAPVYLTLIPVIGGVLLASAGELNFSRSALFGALGSNVAAATRAILSKRKMAVPIGQNMSPSNLYALLTVIAGIVLVPLAVVLEGGSLQSKLGGLDSQTMQYALFSGLFYYLYNEVAFRVLDVVHPVTHAVGNTVKRVVLIFVSAAVFRTQISKQTMQGAAVAIAGVLVYSLTKQHYHNKKAFY